MHASYDGDFYLWTEEQSNFLKNQEFNKLDLAHLVEEIQSLGRSEKRALESHLANLLLHLLKIKYQPNKHTKSWDYSIKNARHKVQLLLKENPSLKNHLPQVLEEAYFTGRLAAISETGLDEELFPETCPWTLGDLSALSSA